MHFYDGDLFLQLHVDKRLTQVTGHFSETSAFGCMKVYLNVTN